jgi:hypothetical protein
MDGSAFDRLVRHVSEDASRRGLLKSAFAATVAGLGMASVLGTEDAEAKSCKAKCKKKNSAKGRRNCKKHCNADNQRCKSENASCNGDDSECCANEHLVCDIPFGAGNSDKKCCRGVGASCSNSPGGPHCCTGSAGRREFLCNASGLCEACPNGLCP